MSDALYLTLMLGAVALVVAIVAPATMSTRCGSCGARNWVDRPRCRACGSSLGEAS